MLKLRDPWGFVIKYYADVPYIELCQNEERHDEMDGNIYFRSQSTTGVIYVTLWNLEIWVKATKIY